MREFFREKDVRRLVDERAGGQYALGRTASAGEFARAASGFSTAMTISARPFSSASSFFLVL